MLSSSRFRPCRPLPRGGNHAPAHAAHADQLARTPLRSYRARAGSQNLCRAVACLPRPGGAHGGLATGAHPRGITTGVMLPPPILLRRAPSRSCLPQRGHKMHLAATASTIAFHWLRSACRALYLLFAALRRAVSCRPTQYAAVTMNPSHSRPICAVPAAHWRRP